MARSGLMDSDRLPPSASRGRTFLLSPAHCGGKRARLLLGDSASFDLAQRLRQPEGAPIGEVFAFISELYFRGKLAYASAFATSAFVITPSRGLMSVDMPVTLDLLAEFAAVDVDPTDARYRQPLEHTVTQLAAASSGDFVLLGSIATDKYVELLLATLRERLYFPETFVGRGDMSRGGVMLRAARCGEELSYVPLAGAMRRGARPPRLPRLNQPRGSAP
jgi:hypothetical protein